ncbi:hypothetical protein BH10PSE14_BH10PSE14_18720 [soil metagenome]|uniref:hypothetical protein n=1 Tax=Sphingomonas sp. TaxID=28214 RepID=UPI001AD17E25|nr:hypothetical protein [Sphingomonas sp.]MBN8816039.1 hypothetical protein [Sphingomonas sp.]MBX9897549.1 hypothetical protein [Qipengyuania sp.]
MADSTITVEGVLVTDITPYRTKLETVRAKLKAIFTGFNPARPEHLLPREAEIVALANDAERLREIVESWDAVEGQRANIIGVWELVRTFDGDEA